MGMFWVVFFATDFTKGLPASAIMIGFVAGTIGFIITQGGIGTYPIMVGSVVTFYRTPELLLESGATGQDVGFGMLVWASQTILIVCCFILTSNVEVYVSETILYATTCAYSESIP